MATKIRNNSSGESILRRLHTLKDMSRAELESLWRELFDKPMPGYNRQVLIRRLAYRLQENARGGLAKNNENKLAALVEANPVASDAKTPSNTKSPVRRGKK